MIIMCSKFRQHNLSNEASLGLSLTCLPGREMEGCRFTSLIRNRRRPPKDHQGPRHSPTAGTYMEAVSHERGTLVAGRNLLIGEWNERVAACASVHLAFRCCMRICSAMVRVPHRPLLPSLPTWRRSPTARANPVGDLHHVGSEASSGRWATPTMALHKRIQD